MALKYHQMSDIKLRDRVRSMENEHYKLALMPIRTQKEENRLAFLKQEIPLAQAVVRERKVQKKLF